MGRSKTLDPDAPRRIKQWRMATGLSRLELSRQLEVQKTTVSNWELGFNEPDANTYRKIGGIAKMPDKAWFLSKSGLSEKEIELLLGTGAPPARGVRQSIDIKVFKAAGAGAFRSVDEVPEDTIAFPRAWLPTTQKLIGLVVQGDSMSPLIRTGFIVIVDCTKKDAESAMNHIVAASEDGGVAIRWLEKRGDIYLLTPHNPDFQPTVVGPNTRIIGVVVKWIGEPPSTRK